MLNIVVERKKRSYDFKVNPKSPSGFDNNYKNNMQDEFVLYDDKAELLRVPVQSVANYCWGEYKSNGPTEHGDTISEGYFKVKLFVEKRNFHGDVHGIIETKDIDGQWINHDSMQIENGFSTGRWLIHDNYSSKLGRETNYAWSAGCLIMTPGNLEAVNSILKAYGCKSGDILNGEIVEEHNEPAEYV